jgi:hypothetical protein
MSPRGAVAGELFAPTLSDFLGLAHLAMRLRAAAIAEAPLSRRSMSAAFDGEIEPASSSASSSSLLASSSASASSSSFRASSSALFLCFDRNFKARFFRFLNVLAETCSGLAIGICGAELSRGGDANVVAMIAGVVLAVVDALRWV